MDSLLAYLGPGAGIAAGTVMLTLLAFLAMLLNFLFWPIRQGIRILKRPKRGPSAVDRVVVIGLDGLDPRRVGRLMDEGKLPSLSRLAASGTFQPLKSTCPPISPVAWSTFLTGVNPGKHGIFDFISRDPTTYLPRLSSAEVRSTKRGADVRQRRGSVPFWKLLGDFGIPSTILRVPITFPAEPFEGSILSAMCIPDLRGTQSSYSFFSTKIANPDDSHSGGLWLPLSAHLDTWQGSLPGPDLEQGSGGNSTSVSFVISRASEREFSFSIDRDEIHLAEGELSDWIRVKFPLRRFRSLSGLIRVQIKNLPGGGVSLYATPIQIDPGKPALPIGFPWVFSRYLTWLIGPYATLGLAEDTSALDDGVIDDATFLKQAADIHQEREAMALELLDHRKKGLFTCVFDGPDRIQHMFFREEPSPTGAPQETDTTIDRTYQQLDLLVEKILTKTSSKDLLLVISDHGFTSFRRGVDLNRWLEEEGLLSWLPEADAKQGNLLGVDWAKTKAYAFGLSGIYFNLSGRESQGIVSEEEVEDLTERISSGLRSLLDEENNSSVITNVHPSRSTYTGPRALEGPDLIVGYNEGYRVSWDCASGYYGDSVLSENTSLWSGDHCVDVSHVPGMLLCNHDLVSESEEGIRLMDLAPSFLSWFGIDPPAHMDGRACSIQAKST